MSSSPSPASILFARGVIARLAYWTALKIAVDQSWGGPESASKRTWLAGVIVDAFEEGEKPDDQYVEEMLLQMMQDEFDVDLEDGSAEGVAVDIVKLWEDVQAGNQTLLTQYEERAEKLKGKAVEVREGVESGSDWESGGEDEESGESMDDVAPQLLERQAKPGPLVDDDGFTLVQGKGKAKK